MLTSSPVINKNYQVELTKLLFGTANGQILYIFMEAYRIMLRMLKDIYNFDENIIVKQIASYEDSYSIISYQTLHHFQSNHTLFYDSSGKSISLMMKYRFISIDER